MASLSRHSLMVVILLLTTPVYAEQLAGLVVSIANGDTITLRDGNRQQHKIHLAGIAAPDVLQSFGQKSKAHLAALVFNREAVAECGKFDQYRRLICKVRINGVDVNLEQVKAGMAWHYTQVAKEQTPQDREDYEVAEFNAKLRRQGLWADKNPVPPWEWRKSSKREFGVADGARTHDNRNHNPGLYQLSYSHHS